MSGSPEWDTRETVAYFQSLDGVLWSICYEKDVPQALEEGYLVKRYTSVRSTLTERVEVWT